MLLDELEADGLIVNFNKVPQTKPKHLPKEVLIWDETLRDGEQTPGTSLLVDEKIEIAKLMDEMGVAIINVGFPAVSKDEQEVVRRIAADPSALALSRRAAGHPGLYVSFPFRDVERTRTHANRPPRSQLRPLLALVRLAEPHADAGDAADPRPDPGRADPWCDVRPRLERPGRAPRAG